MSCLFSASHYYHPITTQCPADQARDRLLSSIRHGWQARFWEGLSLRFDLLANENLRRRNIRGNLVVHLLAKLALRKRSID